jgi:tetratricopeptide (TPR) repeat protein
VADILIAGEKSVRRKLGALLLLASFAAAAAASAQTRAAAPLPAAKGSNENAAVAKAQAALDAKQWPEAEAALKPLASPEPRPEYSEALGNAQYNQAHYEDSLASYQRAIELAPSNAVPSRIYTMIGNANLKLKRNDAAIAAYNKAAALDPNPGTAYFNVCATLYGRDDKDARRLRQGDRRRSEKGGCLFHQGLGHARPGSDREEWQDDGAAGDGGNAEAVSRSRSRRRARQRRQANARISEMKGQSPSPDAAKLRIIDARDVIAAGD